MTIAERIQLHRLGYTKDEISELAKANYDPEGLKEDPKQPEPVPEEPKQPEPVPEEPKQPEPVPGTDEKYEKLLAAVDGLRAALQASNIRTQPQPEPEPLNAQIDAVYRQLTNK